MIHLRPDTMLSIERLNYNQLKECVTYLNSPRQIHAHIPYPFGYQPRPVQLIKVFMYVRWLGLCGTQYIFPLNFRVQNFR